MVSPFDRRQWFQVAGITVGAIVLYALGRTIPAVSRVSHMDFQVSGRGALEMCDPANPAFVTVVPARSPVQMKLSPARPPSVGAENSFTLTMATATGKPISSREILYSHTKLLHLMVVDPTLQDYKHLHPTPGSKPGEWVFTHSPELAGEYRLFADFTPSATTRPLYAAASFSVPGTVDPPAFRRKLEVVAERISL